MKILYFELLKLRKKSRGWVGPILVFVLIMTAFPLTVEFLNKDLDQAFFSVLWIAVMLVMMLATEDIFLEDYNDGTLEQLAINDESLSFVISLKIFIYWILIGVPVSLIGSFYGFGITGSLDLALYVLPVLMITSYIFLNVFSFGNALSLTKGSVLRNTYNHAASASITCSAWEGGNSYKSWVKLFWFSWSTFRHLIAYNIHNSTNYFFYY